MWRSVGYSALCVNFIWQAALRPMPCTADEPTSSAAVDEDPFAEESDSDGTASTDGQTSNIALSDKAPLKREDVLRALERKFVVAFEDEPLSKAVDLVTGKIGVPIMLDRKALEEVGVDLDQRISLRGNYLPGHTQLKLILEPAYLTYVVENGFILITSEHVASEKLRVVVYPIGDLAKSHNAFDELIDDVEPFIQLIESSIDPPTWDEYGGPGAISHFAGNLIVMQSDGVHRKLANFMAKLQDIRESSEPNELPVSIPLDEYIVRELAFFNDLSRPIDLELVNVPLDEAVKKLSAVLKCDIRVDKLALADAGYAPDVTFSCKSLPAAKALQQMLKEHGTSYLKERGISYRFDDNHLLITSSKFIYEEIDVRVYPVRRLIDNEKLSHQAYIDLQSAIKDSVVPTSWDSKGREGTISAMPMVGALLIRQTRENHEHVAKLLQGMWAAKAEAKKLRSDAAQPSFETRVYRLEGVSVPLPPENKGEGLPHIIENAKQAEEIIKEYIDPKSWGDKSQASIRQVRGNLVIRQLPSAHAKINRLLIELQMMYPPNLIGGMSTADGF